MLYPPMSELLTHINSRYLLVNVVAHRARQISIEAEDISSAPGGKARHAGHPRSGRWAFEGKNQGRVPGVKRNCKAQAIWAYALPR